ncbi:hypothetical protein BC628DRAFT_1325565 [Trametes gibbosa]|nr:hypothetical protein BC628DRAFT_1325565 [Trametes gibbosa]
MWSCSGCSASFSREGYFLQHFWKCSTPACSCAGDNYFCDSHASCPFRHDVPHPSRPNFHTAASSLTASSCNLVGTSGLGRRSPSTSVTSQSQSPPRSPQQHEAELNTEGDTGGDPELPPIQFERDYYGNNYRDADFPFGDTQNGPEPEVHYDLHALSQQVPTVAEVSDNENDDSFKEVGLDILDPHPNETGDNTVSEPSSHSPAPPVNSAPDPSTNSQVRATASAQDPTEEPDALSSVPGRIDPAIHDQLRAEPANVTHFGGQAGAPVTLPSSVPPKWGYHTYTTSVEGSIDNPYAPFRSEVDWKIAQWAKMRSPTSNVFSELLQIKGLVETLGLSYKNSNELNTIIDEQLPHQQPLFARYEAEIDGEKFEMYARPVLECILSLYRDPEHAQYLCFAPECHYADRDKTVRLYHDLHTGEWWWTMQSAYPVYLTIGNLPKSILQKPGRQGHILLACLPTSCLDHITNKAARHRIVQNMFHACMKHLLKPLQSTSVKGILMTSGDGVTRRCHPILAAYVGDYPEQCLVSCSYYGDCLICMTKNIDLGDFPCVHPLRNFCASLDAVKMLESDPDRFAEACQDTNIKPVQHLLWEDLPYVNIFQSITSDVLHQLYQGVFKHLVNWLKSACGTAKIDACVARLPPNYSIRIFYKGISNMSRVSGAEHCQISHFLLGVIMDVELEEGRKAEGQLVCATRVLLNFISLAQYPIHSSATLAALNNALDNALSAFHAKGHHDIFVKLGIRTGVDIPKFHVLVHYTRCIKLFGTTDNYNTETSERLHIDLAKNAYCATNHKDEYPQMTKWLERKEKIIYHLNYILWREQQMTRHPTRKSIPLSDIIGTLPSQYGAEFFIPALACFIVLWRNRGLTDRRTLEYYAKDFITPIVRFPVFHRIKFWNKSVYGKETIDSIHVHPRSMDTEVTAIDVCILDVCIAQEQVVFSLPEAALSMMFPSVAPDQRPPSHLAYVEWFSKFPPAPERNSSMYKVSRTLQNGQRVASIIPVSLIEHSIHLIPKWPGTVPCAWMCENVLDRCNTFYVNLFKDSHTYFNLY